MHHTVARILSAWNTDYKTCKNCGKINWYENESCVSCGSSEFRETTEKDIEWILEDLENGNLCEECEIEV